MSDTPKLRPDPRFLEIDGGVYIDADKVAALQESRADRNAPWTVHVFLRGDAHPVGTCTTEDGAPGVLEAIRQAREAYLSAVGEYVGDLYEMLLGVTNPPTIRQVLPAVAPLEYRVKPDLVDAGDNGGNERDTFDLEVAVYRGTQDEHWQMLYGALLETRRGLRELQDIVAPPAPQLPEAPADV